MDLQWEVLCSLRDLDLYTVYPRVATACRQFHADCTAVPYKARRGFIASAGKFESSNEKRAREEGKKEEGKHMGKAVCRVSW